jgi:putative sigma-54 modulation protein
VNRKIGRLDRFLPRHARKSVKADVILREVNRAHGNKYEAEVIVHVPGKTLAAKDSTVNVLAALDIVEAKLVEQFRKYKTTVKRNRRQSIFSKLKRNKTRGTD